MSSRRGRLFLTGASGFVGGGISRAALRHGHRVSGLARSPATAQRLRAAGVEPVPGDLADAESLRRAAGSAEAIVHAGFPRDAYQRTDEAIGLERQATRTLLATGIPLVYTSGIGVVGDTGPTAATEDDPVNTPSAMTWRRELETEVLTAGGVVIRPAFVYGRGEGDILTALIETALRRGVALYPGAGDNSWPTVHIDDLGEAYVLAVQCAAASSVFNIAGGHTSLAEVSEAIGRLIGAPNRTRSVPVEQARGVLPYADWLAGSDIRIDSTRARRLLGWHPGGPDICWDVEFGSYRSLVDGRQK